MIPACLPASCCSSSSPAWWRCSPCGACGWRAGRRAGCSRPGSVYAIGIILAVRFAGAFRFLLPILVLAYVAPFVAGPERLARVLRGRRREEPVVIDVTPKPAPGLPDRLRATTTARTTMRPDDAGEIPADRAGRPARRRRVRRGRRAGDGRPGRSRGGGACRGRRRWTAPGRAGADRRRTPAAGPRRGAWAARVRGGRGAGRPRRRGGGRGRAGRSQRGRPRERGTPRDRSPGPPPGRRPGPAARRAARDARLDRHPAGTRRRRVRRGCERGGDGARRAAVDPRRTHRRAGTGARDRRAPPLRPGARSRLAEHRGSRWPPGLARARRAHARHRPPRRDMDGRRGGPSPRDPSRRGLAGDIGRGRRGRWRSPDPRHGPPAAGPVG